MNNREVHFRLDDKTLSKLKMLSESSGLSKSAIIRTLINRGRIRQVPPADYFALRRELHAIDNNINQIAVVAHTASMIDKELYSANVRKLYGLIHRILEAVEWGE